MSDVLKSLLASEAQLPVELVAAARRAIPVALAVTSHCCGLAVWTDVSCGGKAVFGAMIPRYWELWVDPPIGWVKDCHGYLYAQQGQVIGWQGSLLIRSSAAFANTADLDIEGKPLSTKEVVEQIHGKKILVKAGETVVVTEWHARPNRGAIVQVREAELLDTERESWTDKGCDCRSEKRTYRMKSGSIVVHSGYGTQGWVNGDVWSPESTKVYYTE